jgi:uncharacterized protein YeeX (DUF496 family)
VSQEYADQTDFYFVQPTIAAKRKAEINKKLKEAGKPEIP